MFSLLRCCSKRWGLIFFFLIQTAQSEPHPCSPLVERLEQYGERQMELNHLILDYTTQAAVHVDQLYVELRPLEGVLTTIPVKTFAPLRSTALQMTEVNEKAQELADDLAQKLMDLNLELATCLKRGS